MRSALVSLIVTVTLLLPGRGIAEPLQEAFRLIELRGFKTISANRLQHLLYPQAVAETGETAREMPRLRAWVDGQKITPSTDPQLRCLSEALYFEARGETIAGIAAVGEVILNRVESTRFPNTVCGVVNQGTGKRYQCQFTYTCDGRAETIREPQAYDRVRKVAQLVFDGKIQTLTNGATHYHTTAVRPNWSSVYTRTAKIGKHIFYRHTYRTARN